ncbi:stage III sporulation protein AG [Oscillibacter sp. MSJ-2]|uniref:Stage III sporulation protein AG n=1 Tax=Dysosmobacter acutus TaxID=2841504 RepID=A0ABS6FAV7_9FIRM|nr:stage III sporulation protein AG [Dysosmobacter acutus]MBU5627185.1 stage III sporulation protein AG [Dysosmobacter acutus]
MKANKKDAVRSLWDRYKYVVLVILAGVALLAWPSGSREKEGPAAAPATAEEPTLEQTEERMQSILSKISGAGNLTLMLTLDSTGEKALAQDTELSYSGATEAPEDYQRRSETVVLSESGGGEGAIITKSTCPVYRGALVVCEGGANPEVKLALTQAVAALTGLSSDRITVVRCQ